MTRDDGPGSRQAGAVRHEGPIGSTMDETASHTT